MVNKIIFYITVAIAIIAVVSASFMYVSYAGQINNLISSSTGTKLVDDENYITVLNSAPQRIVSLAPSATQICFALGAGNKVVAVTGALNDINIVSEDYPYNFTAWVVAGNMTFDGAYGSPDTEAIAKLNPDLIIADTQCSVKSITSLRDDGYKVLVLNPANVNGILQDMLLIGQATGTENQAWTAVENIGSIITGITTKLAAANITSPTKVYYEVWDSPYMSVGGNTWLSDAITKAGGTNIFAGLTGWPTVDPEAIIKGNPDVIVLDSGVTAADVQNRTGWSGISAVQNNQIYSVIDPDLFSEPGPRIGVLIQDLAAYMYPQLFNAAS